MNAPTISFATRASGLRLRLGLMTATAIGALAMSGPAAAQMAIPADASPTCVVEPATFQSWFMDDGTGRDQRFRVADSVGFPTDNTACDFYVWGAQMFLWLTSPAGSGLVVDGPGFFNVLPGDASGQRLLQPNTDDAPVAFDLRAGKPDDIGEFGQAGGGGVLLSQAGSLVYYGIHVNDLYAYLVTGQDAGALTGTVFPRNADDLAAVMAYVNANFPGAMVRGPDGLAIELKTSWVALDSIPNGLQDQFLTIEAEVPRFVASADNLTWTEDGTEIISLALTGVHIVGSVQNHPELVWITYEHVLNAPDAAYYYTNSAGDVVLHPYDASGTFLFAATGAPADPANVECMKENAGGIAAVMDQATPAAPVCAGGVVPTHVVRTYPWGGTANSQDADVVTNNTLLLSVNNSIRPQLASGDPRANYVLTGGIWTSAPSATADAPIPNAANFAATDLRGSPFLANTTMETYRQGTNCFTCHNVAATDAAGFGVSHIFGRIIPLVPPAP
ncbi:MAG: hypothetical protein KIS68_10085 [Bauldia sp.]|nr:hypothetical protein [Bauldia sp.]